MAKYEVKFSCGHIDTIELFGKIDMRHKKIEWLEEHGICPDCYKAKKEEERKRENEKAAAAAKATGLPELEGTPKQVAWANTIRIKMLDNISSAIQWLEKNYNKVDDEIKIKIEKDIQVLEIAKEKTVQQTKASWFIDRRYWVLEELLKEYGLKLLF